MSRRSIVYKRSTVCETSEKPGLTSQRTTTLFLNLNNQPLYLSRGQSPHTWSTPHNCRRMPGSRQEKNMASILVCRLLCDEGSTSPTSICIRMNLNLDRLFPGMMECADDWQAASTWVRYLPYQLPCNLQLYRLFVAWRRTPILWMLSPAIGADLGLCLYSSNTRDK